MKLYLVAGALTAVMPHVARATGSERNEFLALTMMCLACAALGSGITSLVTRERHRLLSLAGMALAFLTLLLS